MITKITVSFNDAPIGPPDLAEQVRTAASRGDFALATAVLDRAESANEGELHRLMRLKCEHIVARALVASLADDNERAILLYNEAANFCRVIDPEQSHTCEKMAADALATRDLRSPGRASPSPST